MWDVLVRTPRGSTNPRKLLMLLATFFVACFGYISLAAPSASAAPQATWNGDNISYQSNSYTPVAADATLPVDIPSGSAVYQYTDQSKTPTLAYFIYFSPATDNPKSAKEATYIRYTLNPPNAYTNPADQKTISIKPTESATTPNTSDGKLSSSCTIDGIGWIVCPLMNGIAEGMDFIYERIDGFLTVQPITTSVDNPIYRIWVYARDLANVVFIIGFLVVIYSYLVGGGFNGYEIRKILPRIVLAAVLINVSYILCAAAVDISNIAGHSVNQLFESVRDSALPGSVGSGNVNWTSVTTWVLAGGSGAVASALILPGAVGGLGGLWLMLSTFLLGAVLVVMVTFLILAARQAIIIVLIAIAPLAFAAYVLPNTEKWFDKWKDLFFTMLIMFPAFGAVFGGAQLAGDLIIRMAVANGSIEQVILGLGVMVAPLAITPLLLKLSGGVLGRIGGMINNRQKGVYDRFKNHNEERRQQLIDRNRALNAERRANGDFGGGRFNPRTMVRRRAATNYARRNYREQQQKLDQESAQNYWHRQSGRWGYDNHLEHDNLAERTNARNRLGFRKDGYGNLDTYKRENSLLHDTTEAGHEKHWKDRMNSNSSSYDPNLTKRQMNLSNLQEGVKEADAAYSSMYAAAKTYQTIHASDDAEARAKKEANNARLAAIGLDDNFTQQMKIATATSQSIAVEGLKLKRAEGVAQGQLAGIYKDNLKIRDTDVQTAIERAAGIDVNGKTKVEASATAELTALHMENVKAVNSIFSNDGYSLDELFNVIENKKLRKDATGKEVVADDMHVHAAIQQVLSEKGNNWGAQKLHDYIASQSIARDQEGNIVDTTEEANRKRDLQQIYRDAHINSGLKLGFSSGTDKGAMATGDFGVQHFRHPHFQSGGRFETMSEYSIFRDIQDNKIKPERMAKADIDELMRMVQVMRKPELRSAFTHKQRQTVLDAITEAQTNETLKGLSSDREKDMMRVVAAYLNPNDTRSPVDKENIIIDEDGTTHRAELLAPRYYDPTKLYRYGEPSGPA